MKRVSISLSVHFALLWPFLVVSLDFHLQDTVLLYFVVCLGILVHQIDLGEVHHLYLSISVNVYGFIPRFS